MDVIEAGLPGYFWTEFPRVRSPSGVFLVPTALGGFGAAAFALALDVAGAGFDIDAFLASGGDRGPGLLQRQGRILGGRVCGRDDNSTVCQLSNCCPEGGKRSGNVTMSRDPLRGDGGYG